MMYINELGVLGYYAQFNSYGIYHLNLTTPTPHFTQSLFTVISVPRYIRPVDIKDFPFIWFWSLTLVVLVILIELSFRFYLKVDFFSKKQK